MEKNKVNSKSILKQFNYFTRKYLSNVVIGADQL